MYYSWLRSVSADKMSAGRILRADGAIGNVLSLSIGDRCCVLLLLIVVLDKYV